MAGTNEENRVGENSASTPGSLPSPRPIQPLSATLINKIAAGEVIERPASVVKELLENAMDAGATSITVTLKEGGKELIEVSDNGQGILFEDLQWIFKNHATSKIQAEQDLFSIHTFGFRGEALASLASISKVLLQSKPPSAPWGGEVHAEGGTVSSSPRKSASPNGTIVQAQHLFYNVPARLKFLKHASLEAEHVLDRVISLALANPAISFRIIHPPNTVYALAPASSTQERFLQVFGAEWKSKLLILDLTNEDYRVHLYLLTPPYVSMISRLPAFYLNGRPIRDPGLSRSLNQAGTGFVPHGQRLLALLLIETDPGNVDVNVHPAKIEVRFRNAYRLYDLIIRELRGRLFRTHLPQMVSLSCGTIPPRGMIPPSPISPAFSSPTMGANEPQKTIDQAFHNFFQSPDPVTPALSAQDYSAQNSLPLNLSPLVSPSASSSSADFPFSRLLQIHATYLLREVEDGIEIYDQHALHEKIQLVMIQTQARAGQGLPSQRFLTPEVFSCETSLLEQILEQKESLQEMGFEIDLFGPRQVAVHAAPSFLSHDRLWATLTDLAETLQLSGAQRGQEALREKLYARLACHSAIRAGDFLTPEAMAQLIEQAGTTPGTNTCAHGRPTCLKLTFQELNKYFKRT